MRNFSVSVDAVGSVSVISSATLLGFGGEHNAAQLNFTVDESAGSVFEGVDYYRVVFDDYISDAIISDSGTFVFKVPQEAVSPPIVRCQLSAVKAVDGEPQMIAKSEIFEFQVKFSKRGSAALAKTADVLERTLSACESAKSIAEKSAVSAKESANTSLVCEQMCNRYYEDSFSCSKIAEKAAESAADIVDLRNKGGIANSFKGEASGNGICRLNGVSPISRGINAKVSEILLANGVGDIRFEGVNTCRVVSKSSVYNDYMTPSFTVVLDDGTEYGFMYVDINYYIVNLQLYFSHGMLKADGDLINVADGTYIEMRESTFGEVSDGVKICGIKSNSDAEFEISIPASAMPIKKFGKNLLKCADVNFTLKGVTFSSADDGSLVLNGTSSGELLTNSAEYIENFSFKLPAGTYTLTAINEGNTVINSIGFRSESGNIASFNNMVGTSSKTFTLNEDTDVYIGFYIYGKTYDNARFKFQLELGSTSTGFEPYLPPVSYTPLIDCTVRGITADRGTVTLMAEQGDIAISAEYDMDSEYVIEQLKSAVRALGGAI